MAYALLANVNGDRVPILLGIYDLTQNGASFLEAEVGHYRVDQIEVDPVTGRYSDALFFCIKAKRPGASGYDVWDVKAVSYRVALDSVYLLEVSLHHCQARAGISGIAGVSVVGVYAGRRKARRAGYLKIEPVRRFAGLNPRAVLAAHLHVHVDG